MFKQAVFKVSNSNYKNCPPPDKPEFAFIGRSNVGKSSLINMMANNKDLAKTSSTPGKTQLINHFEIDKKWYLVDLPGYGFAKVSKSLKSTWEKMIKDYLVNRESLVAVCVLIDSRLEPQKIDLEFITWCGENSVPFVLIFTKSDKHKKQEHVDAKVRTFLNACVEIFGEEPTYFVSSAAKYEGMKELTAFFDAEVREYLESKS